MLIIWPTVKFNKDRNKKRLIKIIRFNDLKSYSSKVIFRFEKVAFFINGVKKNKVKKIVKKNMFKASIIFFPEKNICPYNYLLFYIF